MLLDFWPAFVNVTPPAPRPPGSEYPLPPIARPRPRVWEVEGWTAPAEVGVGASVEVTALPFHGRADAGASVVAAVEFWAAPPPSFAAAGNAAAVGSVQAVVTDQPGLLTHEEILALLLDDL